MRMGAASKQRLYDVPFYCVLVRIYIYIEDSSSLFLWLSGALGRGRVLLYAAAYNATDLRSWFAAGKEPSIWGQVQLTERVQVNCTFFDDV